MCVNEFIRLDYIVADPTDEVRRYSNNILNGAPVVVIKNNQYAGMLHLKSLVYNIDKRTIEAASMAPAISLDTDVFEVLSTMIDENVDFLPVINETTLKGIVYRKQMLYRFLDLNEKKSERDKNIIELKKELSLKNKFLAIIGHDVRNIFGQVHGSLELLERRLTNNPDPRVKTIIDLARRSVGHVNIIFEDMLSWARLGTGQLPFKPEAISLNEQLDKIVGQYQLACDMKGIRIENRLATHLNVYADKNMLGCILLNLIYNAIKFSSSGSVVSINAIQSEKYTNIIVSDQGMGITPVQRMKLFKNEMSTIGTLGEAGSGIGLIICKEFVEKHHGFIQIDSNEGEGTRVMVAFPHHQ